MDWSYRFAGRVQRMKPSAIREVLKLTQRGGIISFAGGLPAPGLFPVEEIRRAADRVLEREGRQALQYGTTEGHLVLRERLAASLPGADPGRILVTSGSQQGLDLVARVMLDAGDRVAVAAPTYMGALRAFDAYEAAYLPVASDEHGMLPSALEEALRQRPKMLYVIPDFDNPGGTTTTLERRRVILELAERYGVLVFEDAPYRELRFEGRHVPRLFELAPGQVVHAGTFSKTLVPGFRLGWLCGPAEILEKAVHAKQAADLHTSSFIQAVAAEWLALETLEAQLDRVRDHYRGQRDAMLAALGAHMPPGISWTRPSGGMFLWATLPPGADAAHLVKDAVEAGVAYVPGAPFFADGGGENTLRLSYSVASPEQIERGIGLLGEVFGRSEAVAAG